jgi:hypothetical protein
MYVEVIPVVQRVLPVEGLTYSLLIHCQVVNSCSVDYWKDIFLKSNAFRRKEGKTTEKLSSMKQASKCYQDCDMGLCMEESFEV